MSMRAAPARASTVTRALARDKLGTLAVLAFILASIAPMTVCAGVIPTAYAVTGLTAIPVAFLAVAVVLALFCPGYVAMARRIRNAGSFYAFVSAGLGKVTGVAAALVARRTARKEGLAEGSGGSKAGDRVAVPLRLCGGAQ
jgi:hypothetical protein